jgi:translation elongation factor EF-Tu-like GTPase
VSIITSRSKFSATVELNWLSAAQGGRKRAIGTTNYAATAYFAEVNKQLFSIILHFPAKVDNGVKIPAQTDRAVMNFLAPDLVEPLLKKGEQFHVTEGSRVVAEGKILSVHNPEFILA